MLSCRTHCELGSVGSLAAPGRTGAIVQRPQAIVFVLGCLSCRLRILTRCMMGKARLPVTPSIAQTDVLSPNNMRMALLSLSMRGPTNAAYMKQRELLLFQE